MTRTSDRTLLPNLSAGLIIGLLQIFMALSFAALIFSGDLSDYVSQGIGLALMGTIITGLVIAAFTSLPGTIGGSQGVPAAIMATMAAAIAGGSSSPQRFITVVVAIAIVALATGLFFWILGHFRLGGLVRFLPYPVVGGFLAGTGWLFVTGAIGMMVDVPVEFANLGVLFRPDVLIYWLPGLVLAVIMLVATRRHDHFLVLPAFLVGGVLLFFLVARLAGYSLPELGAQGWLLGPFPEGDGVLWRPITPSMLPLVDWRAIVGQTANILAIMAVSAISLLLNAGGLELATDRDLEVNHELQVAGAANALAGFAAGLVGYKQLSLSTLNFKLGGSSRLPGLVAAVICVLVLAAGSAVLSFFPRVVIGSLLLLLGLDFLYQWVFEGWFRLPKIDYAIVIAILFVTMTAGFLEAIALGLLLAVILFVVSYSQIDVVRHELSGESYKSRVSRSRRQAQILQQEGDRLYILQLQGFIFFGTANNLLNQLRARILDPSRRKPDYMALDFQRVTGLDSTGLLSFTRMKQLAEDHGFTLIFTAPNERVLNQLEQGGLGADAQKSSGDPGEHLVLIFHSLEQGVEWCENRLLAGEDAGADGTPGGEAPPLAQQLQEILSSGIHMQKGAWRDASLQSLIDHLEKIDVAGGDLLIKMGDEADNLYFVESCQVTAQLPRPGQPPVRLQTTGSGNVIGEIGFYLGQGRTADVVIDRPGTIYRLSLEDLQRLEETDPEAASLLHQIVVHLLAERLIHLTNTVQALER
jgi:SulP family sulfate permease